MQIGGVDKIATKKLKKREQRESSRSFSAMSMKPLFKEKTNKEPATLLEIQVADEKFENVCCEESVPGPSIQASDSDTEKRNLLKLENLPRILDKYKISDRVDAAIASAALADAGLVSKTDKSHVIDKSKIRRARAKTRSELQSNTLNELIRGLYFDGRKDKTMKLSLDSKRRVSTVQEHIVLIEEPKSVYLGHVSPATSSAENIFRSIIDFCESSSKTLNSVKAIGCDGTITNTGHKSGIIVRLEQHIKAPVHWFVCQLHANELPLRHLIQHLDGDTTGPNVLSGVIGKELQTCENLPRADFKIIHIDLPDISRETLSTDQLYLFDIC